MAEHWVCVFEGRAGGQARAVFETSEQARGFAERHARSSIPPDAPFTWDDVSESAAVLMTQLGIYRVTPAERRLVR